MAQSFVCDWCGNSFKTEDGLQWHVEAHQREWGLVIYLDREWGPVGTSVGGVPGKYVIVLPSLIKRDMSDEESLAAIKRDIARFGPIIRAIEQQEDVR